MEKYQKSYNIKNSAPLIALDMGTHQYQNFLGCMSIVDGIVCKYVLQYLSTGIIEKDINSILGLVTHYFPNFEPILIEKNSFLPIFAFVCVSNEF